ncbi:MAG: Gfo/Idh/MocA family oxidoreductase [Candidatus Handelsmanbacteria bacterium]|nr:Gfo/Idh/MocA family oxidoreductase [Candidatus Handelsmanbacteria bacterium]
MKTYRVAILGCRSRGRAAARAYHLHPRTEVVALCDLEPARLEALGGELGVAARYIDLDQMLDQERPDLVAIPTGTEFHYRLVMRVLERGFHVEVEKPMCTNLEEADAMVALAQARGVRLAAHHQGRVGPPMRALEQALADGRIGQLRHVQGSGKGYYAGYGLMNIGTHMLTNICGVAGACRSVAVLGLVAGRRPTPEDVQVAPGGMGVVVGERLTAVLEFGDNVSGVLLQHRFPKVDSAGYMMEVYGTEGRLCWKTGGLWWLPVPHFVPGGPAWEPLETPGLPGFVPSQADASDYAFADEFVRALDEGREHLCGGWAARHVLEIMMGIFASVVSGGRVELPQVDRRHPLVRWREEAGLGPAAAGSRDYAQWLAEEDRRLGRE